MCSYGPSVIAHASCSMHSSAISPISSRVSTRPVGLCGVLTMIAFVLRVERLAQPIGDRASSSAARTARTPASRRPRIASGP